MACGANVHAGWWGLAGTTKEPIETPVSALNKAPRCA